jgi:hypothetical protein
MRPLSLDRSREVGMFTNAVSSTWPYNRLCGYLLTVTRALLGQSDRRGIGSSPSRSTPLRLFPDLEV